MFELRLLKSNLGPGPGEHSTSTTHDSYDPALFSKPKAYSMASVVWFLNIWLFWTSSFFSEPNKCSTTNYLIPEQNNILIRLFLVNQKHSVRLCSPFHELMTFTDRLFLVNQWHLWVNRLVTLQCKTHLMNRKWLCVVLVGLWDICVILVVIHMWMLIQVYLELIIGFLSITNMENVYIKLSFYKKKYISDSLYLLLKFEWSHGRFTNTVKDMLCIPSNPALSDCESSLPFSGFISLCVYVLVLHTVTRDQQVCDCWTSTGRVKG